MHHILVGEIFDELFLNLVLLVFDKSLLVVGTMRPQLHLIAFVAPGVPYTHPTSRGPW
jgi:hypothetical protein